jgi:hypothetical protein
MVYCCQPELMLAGTKASWPVVGVVWPAGAMILLRACSGIYVCVMSQRFHCGNRGSPRLAETARFLLCVAVVGGTLSCLFACACVHFIASHASIACVGCCMILYNAAPAVRGPQVLGRYLPFPHPQLMLRQSVALWFIG